MASESLREWYIATGGRKDKKEDKRAKRRTRNSSPDNGPENRTKTGRLVTLKLLSDFLSPASQALSVQGGRHRHYEQGRGHASHLGAS